MYVCITYNQLREIKIMSNLAIITSACAKQKSRANNCIHKVPWHLNLPLWLVLIVTKYDRGQYKASKFRPSLKFDVDRYLLHCILPLVTYLAITYLVTNVPSHYLVTSIKIILMSSKYLLLLMEFKSTIFYKKSISTLLHKSKTHLVMWISKRNSR